MKKGLFLSIFAVLAASAVCAFPSAPADNAALNAAVEKAVAAKKQDIASLQKAVLTSTVAAKNEIARMKEPNFSWAFQSLVKVMDSYQAGGFPRGGRGRCGRSKRPV